MATKQVFIHDVDEFERRSLLGTSMIVRDEGVAYDSHEAYCFIPVDCLHTTDSPRTIINQLSSAFNSGHVRLDIMESGFDRRLSIRITYWADGPDPDGDE